MEAPAPRRQVFGVDFSGGVHAGHKIRVAAGKVEGNTLRIVECRRGSDLPGSGRERDQCLAALRAFIGRRPAAVFGLDFPFGLPRALVGESSWEEFVLRFPERYLDPRALREACRAAAGGAELKRRTDRTARVPFSPYNLWLFRQTFFGIRDLLRPLVRDGLACVLPMQEAQPGKPWLIEICPASTLKALGKRLYRPYKGKAPAHRVARKAILDALERTGQLAVGERALRARILADAEGDALDSVVAAFAAFRAPRQPGFPWAKRDAARAVEGHVYV